jgi:hypothetical protein
VPSSFLDRTSSLSDHPSCLLSRHPSSFDGPNYGSHLRLARFNVFSHGSCSGVHFCQHLLSVGICIFLLVFMLAFIFLAFWPAFQFFDASTFSL